MGEALSAHGAGNKLKYIQMYLTSDVAWGPLNKAHVFLSLSSLFGIHCINTKLSTLFSFTGVFLFTLMLVRTLKSITDPRSGYIGAPV